MKLTREQRRQMERENAKRPDVLKQVPRNEWPPTAPEKLIEAWMSRFFLVQIYNEGDIGIRLTVNRTLVDVGGGWQQDITWEQLQAIKRECGYGDRYAVEVFPRDKDVVNVANMRHLWIPPAPLNIGWTKA